MLVLTIGLTVHIDLLKQMFSNRVCSVTVNLKVYLNTTFFIVSACTENELYCISNEELRKVIPERKLESKFNVVPKEPLVCRNSPILIKPSAPPLITVSPIITEINKNRRQPRKTPRDSKQRVVIKENVKEFRSKTGIIPNYCKYFCDTIIFHFRHNC